MAANEVVSGVLGELVCLGDYGGFCAADVGDDGAFWCGGDDVWEDFDDVFDGSAQDDEISIGEAFGEVCGSVCYGALADCFLEGGRGAADAGNIFGDAALQGGHSEGAA